MPTDQTTTEKFVMIRHGVIKAGLTPQAFTIYAALAMYADWRTAETYVSRQTLAEHIGAKQPRSVDRYISELVKAGLILSVRHRWTTQRRDMDDVVFEKDAEHPVQTSSLYVVNLTPTFTQVEPQCAKTHGGGAPERTGVVRQNAHNLEPLTYNHLSTLEKSSVAGADRDHSNGVGDEPTALPSTWTPNPTHVRIATDKGLDVEELADNFRVQMRSERRRNWDKAFGKFINEYAEYRAESVFPAFPSDEDDDTPTTTVTGPNPTADALAWATGALWSVDINPDTLTADERADIVFACEPTADPHDVARRIRENRERRHLTVVPNTTVTEATAQVAAALGELSEDERDAIDLFVDRHGFGADDLVRYIAAWRKGEPFSLIELEPEEYDPFTGVMNPNPAITGAELRDALDRIKRMLPGGFRSDEMETARDAILYGDSWSQVAETLRDGRISA